MIIVTEINGKSPNEFNLEGGLSFYNKSSANRVLKAQLKQKCIKLKNFKFINHGQT